MNCKNIFLVTWQDESEINAVMDSLKKRYSGRYVKEIVLSFQVNKDPCFVPKLVPKEPEPEPTDADTGIYVIAHGKPKEGFVTYGDLLKAPTRTAFVKWLLSLIDRKLSIRKLSFLACFGIRYEIAELAKKKPYGVETALQEALQKDGEIFVQHMCQAISDVDTSRKLEGLMVAGYVSAVYVTGSGHKTSVSPKSSDDPRYQMRPTLPDKPPERPTRGINEDGTKEDMKTWKPRFQAQVEAESKYKKDMETFKGRLLKYGENKIVYVFKSGAWVFGKLSDYTDKADWKTELIGAGL